MSAIYGVAALLSLILAIGYCSLVRKKEFTLILIHFSIFIVNTGYFLLAISKSLEEALLANRIVYLGASLETAAEGIISAGGSFVMTEYENIITFVRNDSADVSALIAEAATAEAEYTKAEYTETTVSNANLEEKYICTKFETAGTTLDAASLGAEYSVVFHEDGTLDFVMAGADVPGLKWEALKVQKDADEVDAYQVIYFDGSELNFIMTENGFELDFFGSMILYFEIDRK